MIKHPRFLDLYHDGEVPATAIDDYIADWHDHPQRVSLHTFLGMTWGEYRSWTKDGQLPTEDEHYAVPQSDMVFVAFAGDDPEDLTALRTHGIVHCRPACPIHWPSDHPKADWPLGWDPEQYLTTRICGHGMHHPDPDDQQVRLHPELAEHDCDGCCKVTIDGEVRTFLKQLDGSTGSALALLTGIPAAEQGQYGAPADGEFFEEDEPVAKVLEAFERGRKGITRRPS